MKIDYDGALGTIVGLVVGIIIGLLLGMTLSADHNTTTTEPKQ